MAAPKTTLMEEDMGFIDAHRLGPTPTESTDITLLAAIASALTLNKYIYLPPGAWTIANDVVVPITRGLFMPTGTIITVSSGKTLTILGPLHVEAGASFQGPGITDYSHAIFPTIPGPLAIADKQVLGNMRGVTASPVGINPHALVSTNFDFIAQAPGGSLTNGVPNTVTLTPVPAGVNGTDVGHYLYVSGGVGVAEAVLITGGTALSGAASGTIIFTPANNHSGAWTLISATAGIYEALQAAGSRGAVRIPGGNHTLYTKLIIPYFCSLRGAGHAQTTITMAAGYTARGIEVAVTYFDFGDLSLVYTTIGLTQEGLYLSGVGDSDISNLGIFYAWDAIAARDGCYRVLFQNINTFQYNDAFRLGTCVVTIENARCNMNGITTGVALRLGDGNQFTETVMVNNFNSDGGAIGIRYDSNAGHAVQVTVTNSQFDSCHVAAIFVNPTGTGLINSWHFSNCLFSTQAQGITTVAALFQTLVAFGINQIVFTGCRFLCAGNFAHNGVVLNGGVSGFRMSDCIIMSNSGSLGSCVALSLGSTSPCTDIYIGGGNVIGVGQFVEQGANAFTYGLTIAAVDHDHIQIVGNPLIYGSTTPFVQNGTDVDGVMWSNNGGIDDVVGIVASGASIVAPVNSAFTVIGNTQITTILGGFAGRTVTLIFTNAAPGGVGTGGNIARTQAAVQNQAIRLTYNGTTWY